MKYQPSFNKYMNDGRKKRKSAYIAKVLSACMAASMLVGSTPVFKMLNIKSDLDSSLVVRAESTPPPEESRRCA